MYGTLQIDGISNVSASIANAGDGEFLPLSSSTAQTVETSLLTLETPVNVSGTFCTTGNTILNDDRVEFAGNFARISANQFRISNATNNIVLGEWCCNSNLVGLNIDRDLVVEGESEFNDDVTIHANVLIEDDTNNSDYHIRTRCTSGLNLSLIHISEPTRPY